MVKKNSLFITWFIMATAFIAVFCLPYSYAVAAQIDGLIFTTDEQQVVYPGEVSKSITVRLVDKDGNEVEELGETGDLFLESSSETGLFLNDNGDGEYSSTVNSNWNGRNFTYKDPSQGEHIITATIKTRDSEQSWTAEQKITVSKEDFEMDENGKKDTEEEEETAGDNDGDNEDEAEENDDDDPDTTPSPRKPSAHSSPVEISALEEVSVVKISAGRDRLTSVESPIRFEAYMESSNVPSRRVSFEWAMGDGSVKKGREIEHSYYAPGNYSVVLTAKIKGEEAVSRVEVEVLEPEISITEADERMVTLFNSSEGEINLGEWRLKAGDDSFEIPQNTIISAEGELSLPRQVTEIEFKKGDSLELISPEGGFNESFSEEEVESEESEDQEIIEDNTEVERLRAEVSDLREEINRLLAEEFEPDRGDIERPEEMEGQEDRSENSETEEEKMSSSGVESSPEIQTDEDLEAGSSRSEVIFEVDNDENKIWRRLLGTPASVFDRLSF
ncbi:MAG: PKD domain-containing protein [Candidatus Paceibacterota bacterium]